MSDRYSILIISRSPYGKLIDWYRHAENLSQTFLVMYLGFEGKTVQGSTDKGGVQLEEVPSSGGTLLLNLRFLISALNKIKNSKPDVVIVVNFLGCSLLRLLAPKVTIILDIRTGSVCSSRLKRCLMDTLLRCEANCFNAVTIITASLATRLGLKPSRYKLLPLGGDIFYNGTRKIESLKLLYVGTLDNRRLDDTISGVQLFLQHHPHSRQYISYTIIGDGFWCRAEDMVSRVKEQGLDDIISVKGYISPDTLAVFFATHNVGVSYVPVTPYFDVQPATKTYEYLLSGMAVIATKTQDNIGVINKYNGILCEDTPAGFALALAEIFDNRTNYSENIIRGMALGFTWDQITREHLLPIINEMLTV